jgi:hypothetical protein
MNDHTIADFRVGQRIECHPATNAWIFGDRCGEVVKVGRKLVHVRMDRSGRTLRFHPRNILWIISQSYQPVSS